MDIDARNREAFLVDLHFLVGATHPDIGHGSITREHIWSWFIETWERVDSGRSAHLPSDIAFVHEFAEMLREAKAKHQACLDELGGW